MELNLPPHGLPGLLLTVCGPDGCGKSTLEAGLLDRLASRGVTPQVLIQPSAWWREDPRVRSTMVAGPRSLDPLALALFALADRVDQQAHEVLPVLAAGGTILSNRYLLSLCAHFLTTREIDQALLTPLYRQLVAPDLMVVLDAPTPVLLDRVVRRDGPDPRRWDQQPEFVARNREAFLALARANGALVLDTTRPAPEVLDTVWDRVAPLLPPGAPPREGR
ncbi:hypothetical protein GCM10009665_16150 [Kitasatospora nipponensis]|uniref:Thymidylate kinase n=1 Tax=Kitasatospora nipponensis TaxID=258049 RepID=A0ABN1W0F1_9ACTN